jgi:hypothetical protein
MKAVKVVALVALMAACASKHVRTYAIGAQTECPGRRLLEVRGARAGTVVT